MILDEFCQKQRGMDYSILCTDICTEVLGQAIAGRFSEQMIEPVSMARRQRYLMRARDASRNEVRIKPQLRSKLAFGRLNLMDDAYPIETGSIIASENRPAIAWSSTSVQMSVHRIE
jgi:chemotaxis protein methyltransferase CheR